MRRLTVGIALCFAAISGGIVGAGTAHATDRPAADDWSVRGTYVSRMYMDYGDAYALASAGGCTAGAQDDSCA